VCTPVRAPLWRRRRGQPGQSLSSEAVVLAFGAFVSQGLTIFSLAVLARLLTRSQLGSYQQLLLVFSIVSTLLIAGLPSALLYFLPKAPSVMERRRWVFDTYLVMSGFGLFGALGLVIFRHALAHALGNPGLAPALAYYAPVVLFSPVSGTTAAALIGHGRSRLAALVTALNAVTLSGGMIAAALISPTAVAVATGASVASGTVTISSLVLVIGTVGTALPRSIKDVAAKRLLGYGIPLALTGAVGILGGQLDRVVVTSNFSPADYSVYAIGAAQVPLLYLVRQPVNNVLIRALSARFEADDLSGAARLWRESMRKLSLVVMPAFVYSVIMAPDLIRVLYGSGWGASVEIFRIYQTLLLTQITTWGLIPMAAGRTRENVWGAVILLVLNGGIAYALIGPFGLTGAAVATPLATLGAIAYFLLRIRAVFNLPIRKLGPWTDITLNLLCSGVAGVPLLAFVLLPGPAVLRLGISGLAFLVSYVFVMRVTKRITDEDWLRLRSALGRLRPRVVAARV
jgi:O-antigen/teichoic acid export membrane protein